MRTPKQFPILPGTRHDSPVFGTDSESFSLADVFGPSFEGTVLPRKVEIESEQIRKLMRKDYLYISKMLHTLTRAREYSAADQGKLNRIEEGLEAALGAVRKIVTDRTIELQSKFNKRPDAVLEVVHGRRTTFNAPVASPHAFTYLQMLEEADVFFGRAQAAWLQKVTQPQQHNDLVREIKRYLFGVKHHITTARLECFKLMRQLHQTMDKADPDAARLGADVQNSANLLMADAKVDSEVRSVIGLSAGRELETVTGHSLDGVQSDGDNNSTPVGSTAAAPESEPKPARKSSRQTAASGESSTDTPAAVE